MISGNLKYIRDIEYMTADDFLKATSYASELHKIFNHKFIFHCHSSDKYELTPYLLRRGVVDSYFSPDEINVAKGTKVRIHGGQFNGLEGTFIKVKGARDRRVVVEVSGVIVLAT